MSNKKIFDTAVQGELEGVNREKEREEIIRSFEKFVNKPIPEAVNAYDWVGSDVLLEVFKFVPDLNDGVDLQMDEKGRTMANSRTRYFPIAKVLAAGDSAYYNPTVTKTEGEHIVKKKIEAGQFVKLVDVDVMSIETSKFQEWNSSQNRNGNLKPKGDEPMRYVSNIYKSYGRFTFVLNPFDTVEVDKNQDDSIYCVPSNLIINQVKDVKLLIDLCS